MNWIHLAMSLDTISGLIPILTEYREGGKMREMVVGVGNNDILEDNVKQEAGT